MKNNKYFVLIKLLLLALIISAIPIVPTFLMPIWSLLFFSYWMLYSYHAKPAFPALIFGLFFDVLYGDLLGQHSLALILSSLFIFYVKQSFYFSNTTTQQVYLTIASTIYILSLWFSQMLYSATIYLDWQFFIGILITPIIWPITLWFCGKICAIKA